MADDAAVVEAARTRARRRLIGALVLLVAGVIGFPLLFETQPRPLPVDTPIEVQPRELAAAPAPAPLPMPPVPVPVPVPKAAPALPGLPPSDAGAEVPPASTATPPAVRSSEAAPAAASSAAAAAAPASAPRAGTAASAAAPPSPAPRAATLASTPATPAPSPAAPASLPDDGARARALLEGTAAAATSEGADAPLKAEARFVVQVGAYTDAATLREARQRVEKLGLKTYTQVVDTESGKRTRVRIGPYASREEADAAAAKVKRAGLPANILAL